MSKFNQKAFGQVLRVNFGEDVSSATAFVITLTPERGEASEKTGTLGTSAVTVDDTVFAANQYCEYTLLENDLEAHVGRWQKSATATMPTATVSTDPELFRVME